MAKTVTVIPGDGIGPEVMAAAQRVIAAAGARIDWETCEAGAAVFKRGDATGVPRETVDSIMRTRAALKGPLETPVGFGERSANVTLRKMFELYGNIRPTRELPGVPGVFAGRKIDLIVVRENVEDLYAGVEHMQTPGVAQCLKLISRKGCEKIVRLAFELARAEGRRKVHCATKANIMKMTEGLLKRTFEEIAPEYSELKTEHIIIDNCAHQLVRYPEQFDVIVTTNMNGDIISDLTSGLTGGLGLAPSANLGNETAMFEAVHGSAPTIAGKNVANPTALILSGVMMLRHLGEFAAAAKIEQAVVYTLKEGKTLTVDLIHPDLAVTTTQFTDALMENFDKPVEGWQTRAYRPLKLPQVDRRADIVRPAGQRCLGVDVFLQSALGSAELGQALATLTADGPLILKTIANRGVQVWPQGSPLTDCVDHYRCRFLRANAAVETADADILTLLQKLGGRHRWVHVEKLAEYDGKPAYSRDAGE